MRGFAIENGIDKTENVKASTVGHCGLDGLDGNLVAFGQQLELFDFLRRCQQVAFHPRRNQVHGITLG
ncbi:hypothetical protein D3C77_697300 [compost metagenome]